MLRPVIDVAASALIILTIVVVGVGLTVAISVMLSERPAFWP
jgi:hypothetical protein